MRLRLSNSGPIALITPRPLYIHKGRPFLTAFNSDPINISIERNMPYPAQSLYPLIADVDSYSKFLPFCTGSTVTRRDAANSPTHADLQVGFNSWAETFSSRVSCVKNEAVTAEASEHPVFQQLKATWKLTPEGKAMERGTTVSLDIKYNFTNPLYNTLARQFAPQVAEKLVQAFETRAKEILD